MLSSCLILILPALAGAAAEKSSGKECKVVLAGGQDNQALISGNSRFLEFTYIKNGQSQMPLNQIISGDYFSDYSFYQDMAGDRVSLSIYPSKIPFFVAPGNQTQIAARPQPNQSIGYSNVNSIQNNRNAVQVRNSNELSTATNSVANISVSEKRKIVEKWVDKAYEGFGLSPAVRETVITTTLGDEKLMTQVMETRVAVANAVQMKLSNIGEDRFFWFKPNGSSEFVAARILDLHRFTSLNRQQYGSSMGFTILAEYAHTDAVTGVRSRIVLEVSEKELATFTRDQNELSVAKAREQFSEHASPLEMETKKLAAKLRARLFGFSTFGRTPGQTSDYGVKTPLDMLNHISTLAMRHDIEEQWGKFDDLLTSNELKNPLYNVIDVFARLNPKYVLQRFKSEKLEYTWVITEDGQLKIVPKMKIGNNLKSQLLRLSGGRRIFAGGGFIIGADGSIQVRLDSNGYQNADTAWGTSASFNFENPNLNSFISAIFATHVGVQVSNIDAKPVAAFTDTENAKYASAGTGSQQSKNQFGGFESQEAWDFVNKMKSSTGQAPPVDKKGKAVTWDEQKGFPVSYDNWIKLTQNQMHERDSQYKVLWAHYVLKTDHTMKWGDIKKRSKALVSKFHPDLHQDNPNSHEATSSVTTATTILKGIMND